jgi:hypothetical protein
MIFTTVGGAFSLKESTIYCYSYALSDRIEYMIVTHITIITDLGDIDRLLSGR